MTPEAREQLSKVKRAVLPYYDDNTTVMHIHKLDTFSQEELRKDGLYLVSIDDHILNPPDGYTLHSNWNGGIAPVCKYMKIDVLNILGRMIKVASLGYDMSSKKDTKDVWEGWLPIDSITILEKL